MKTWTVGGTVTISVYTTVEAETAEEAIRIAAERGTAQPRFDYDEHENDWVCDELDGEVEGLTVEP